MSDALTQEEIDALREAVSSGADLGEDEVVAEEPKEQVKVVQYDFRKPRLISAESLHVIQMLHEESAKTLEAFLLSELKASGNVKLSTMDQITYSEFVMSIVPPAYVVRVGAGDLGSLAIEIGTPLVMSMLDILLGGSGSVEGGPDREITVLEKTVLEGVLTGVIERVREAWAVITPVEMAVEDVVSNAEYLQAASHEAPCINLSYDVRIASGSGLINICYPITLVQGIIKRADKGKAVASKTTGKGMLRALGEVPLQIRAVLGDIQLIAEDLGKLDVGDVVCLDKSIDEPVDVFLGEASMFSAHMGKRKDKLAVELLGYRGLEQKS